MIRRKKIFGFVFEKFYRVFRGARFLLLGTVCSFDESRALKIILFTKRHFISNCLLPNLAMLYGRFCGAWPVAYRLLFLMPVIFRNQLKNYKFSQFWWKLLFDCWKIKTFWFTRLFFIFDKRQGGFCHPSSSLYFCSITFRWIVNFHHV